MSILKMKWCAGLIVAALSLPALAVPVHATFSGTVTGASGFNNDVLNQFPIGTGASFDVTFDDTNLGGSASTQTAYGLAPVSGSMTLGALTWLLDAGNIWSYTYQSTPGFPITSYGLQLTGTGPSFGPNASLFGLFLRIAPDLTPDSTNPFMAGFRYPVSSGEYYSYAQLTGTHSITRGATPVPEPTSLLLLSFALGLLALLHRTLVHRRLGVHRA